MDNVREDGTTTIDFDGNEVVIPKHIVSGWAKEKRI